MTEYYRLPITDQHIGKGAFQRTYGNAYRGGRP